MKALAFAVALCCAAPAAASEWFYVAGDDSNIFFVDRERVRDRAEGQGTARGWFESYHRGPHNWRAKTLVEVDCDGQRYRYLRRYEQRGERWFGGQWAEVVRDQVDWDHIMPETNMENVFRFICAPLSDFGQVIDTPEAVRARRWGN